MIFKNKFVAIVLLFLLLFSNNLTIVNAVDISNAKLENGASCTGHLQYNFGSFWGDVIGNLIYYVHNGIKYPAYCISTPDTPRSR